MADRAPLPGWTTDYQRFMGMRAGGMYLTIDIEDGNPHVPSPTKARYWVEGSFERSRAVKDLDAALIAAEDAARALVSEMAAALGGRVMWGVPCPGCGTTEPDIVVDGETQCGRCGMIGSPVESEEDHG